MIDIKSSVGNVLFCSLCIAQLEEGEIDCECWGSDEHVDMENFIFSIR